MATKVTPKDFVEALKEWSVLDVKEALEILESELGIKPAAVMPVMSEQFSIRFPTNSEADLARARLAALEVDGESLIGFAPAPDRTVFFGAMRRYHTPLATSQPSSFAVGTSGNTGWRCGWNATRTRMRLPSTCPLSSPGCATSASMWPPSSDGLDWPQPA